MKAKQEVECWVTTVDSDRDALQAWALACSLKNSNTTKKLAVIVSENVSPHFTYALTQEFHHSEFIAERAALKILHACCEDESEEPEVKVSTLSRQALLRCWPWLMRMEKCVHLPPNALVLKNCDDLFECKEFATIEGSLGSVYVFKPNLSTFAKLVKLWSPNSAGEGFERSFCNLFRDSQVSSAGQFSSVLGSRYYVEMGKAGAAENAKMIGFKQHAPWTVNSVEWLKIYEDCILPRLHSLQTDPRSPTNNFGLGSLLDFVRQQGLKTIQSMPRQNSAHLQLASSDQLAEDSIAVIGMSCRFPGCNNISEYWNLLAEGRNAVGQLPAGRENTYVMGMGGMMDIDGVESGYLKCPVEEFDAKFFGISPRESQFIDPQQRLLLEVTWEALEDAGIPPLSLKNSATGSYLGIWQKDYERRLTTGSPGHTSAELHHIYLGNAFSATSSRISHFLGLLGPNFALEAGCASSLVAFHLACQALLAGEVSVAISSGVNLVLGATKPGSMEADNKSTVLSPDYRCKTFDATANGFVRAEGCGAVILKRTADAVRDGDNILAIIRGSALSNDGAGTSFGTPNVDSQKRLCTQALKNAGVRPAEVSYVEAHGTGTPVGDPIEAFALAAVYSQGRAPHRPLHIASVKTNIGHTESAAGIAGLIKTVLALQHRQIPAHLNLTTLNPEIDLSAIPAIIPTRLTDWGVEQDGYTRIAALNSFSMSGANVHVILQESLHSFSSEGCAIRPNKSVAQLLTISAKSQTSLHRLVAEYSDYLAANPSVSLQNMAYTTNVCRAHNFPHRIALSAKDMSTALANLKTGDYLKGKAGTVKPKLGFLFTGQGSQYVGMGQTLCQNSGPFASAFKRCNQLFHQWLGVGLDQAMWSNDSSFQHTLYCQPTLFCLQYCLLCHWAALGVRPEYVLGHSVGEFAAAVAAGVFTVEQAMELVVERSRLVNSLPESRMLVLYCSQEGVNSLLKSFHVLADGRVDLAAVNSPSEVVVSGTTETLASLEDFCYTKSVKCQQLGSKQAFHSREMDSILPAFEEVVRRVVDECKTPETKLNCTFISGTCARVMETSDLLKPSYWTRHLRDTVRFSDAVQMFGDRVQCNILLEIGPQPILLGLAMANLANGNPDTKDLLYFPSLRRPIKSNDWDVMLDTVGRLYVEGVDVDWKDWYVGWRGAARLQLPHYQFDRQHSWYNKSENGDAMGEGGASQLGVAYETKTTVGCHPLLGSQFPSPTAETVYDNFISTARLPYLADHKICDKIVLPGAVYLELALGVGKQILGIFGNSLMVPLTVTDFNIEAAFELQASGAVRMQTVVSSCESVKFEEGGVAKQQQYAISFHRPAVVGHPESWKRQATVRLVLGTCPITQPASSRTQQYEDSMDLDAVKNRLVACDQETVNSMYESAAASGCVFGSTFRSILAVWTKDTEALAVVKIPSDAPTQPPTGAANGGISGYVCHPIVIDAMIQFFVFGNKLSGTLTRKDLLLPFSVRRFLWKGRSPTTRCVYAYTTSLNEVGMAGENTLCLYDECGTLLAVMEGLQLIETTISSFLRALRAESVLMPDFYEERWVWRLGVTQQRFKLVELAHLQRSASAKTAKKLEEIREFMEEGAAGRRKANLMCFYFMVKCMYDCGWPIPSPNDTVGLDLWQPQIAACEHLRGTRLHEAFIAALEEEGYLEQLPNARRGMSGDDTQEFKVVRSFPSQAECEEEIFTLREQIPLLLPNGLTLYKFGMHCAEQLCEVISGRSTPLDVLFPSDASKVGAQRFYQEDNAYKLLANYTAATFGDLVSTLKHSALETRSGNVLRVLEVGAGTGATTGPLLQVLQQSGVGFLYTFTDISQQFLNDALENFGNFSSSMVYAILNIERDPLAQGFAPQEYDVVIATHVVHATANLETTFSNLRTLMRPGGIIVVTELFKTDHVNKVSFATLEGWWRFNDFRTMSPVCGPNDWMRVLERVGFQDVTVFQGASFAHTGMFVGRAPANAFPVHPSIENSKTSKTWILCGTDDPLMDKIRVLLQMFGRTSACITPGQVGCSGGMTRKVPYEYSMDFTNPVQFDEFLSTMPGLGSTMDVVEGVVYFATEGDPDFDRMVEIQRVKIGGLLHLLQALANTCSPAGKPKPKTFVLTRGVHYLGDQNMGNPSNATVWSMFRSFVNEHPDFPCCAIDLDQDQDEGTAEEICAELWSGNLTRDSADKFLMFRGGKKFAHQLATTPTPTPPLSLPANIDRHIFINPHSGAFADMRIGPDSCSSNPLDVLEMEVEVRAVGLNFRDLLCVLKPPGFEQHLRTDAKGWDEVGSDIAGVVVAVGQHVSRFQVGDAVYGRTNGGMKSHAIVHESEFLRKPTWMPFTAAATIPAVFLTSHWCLTAVAGVHSHDRILIHAATGGVGLSAIQVARQLGATIYATAGSKRKRAYLRQLLGLPHVYNSRSLEYGPAIMADTGGAGVTVVLNSLTSPGFKEATLDCCALGARFVEIGKLDIWSEEQVRELRPDVRYSVVNLADVEEAKVATRHSLQELDVALATGIYKPLPRTVFALERLRDAFEYFLEVKHVGKIVIKMPVVDVVRMATGGTERLTLKHLLFDSESTYLITGGLGGIGLQVVKWMASTGARHIVLAGRNPPTPPSSALLDEIRATTGCEILVCQADVGHYAQCDALLDKISASGMPPLRGIFLASGVLRDTSIENQSLEKFEAVFHPKVYSAWWFHLLTTNYDLEFFIMFSSLSATVGMLGQSPHSAACGFLDSLAHYRLAIGLPAASINWGAWSDVGAAANLKIGEEGMMGLRPFTPSQGINALEHFMLQNYKQAAVADVPDWTIVRLCFNLGSFLGELKGNALAKTRRKDEVRYEELQEEIRRCSAAEKETNVEKYLEMVLKQTLGLPETEFIDRDQQFQELGLDSLMAMELNNRVKKIMATSHVTSLTVQSLRENPTLRTLSAYLARLLNSESDVEEGGREEELMAATIKLIEQDARLPDDIREAIVQQSKVCPNPQRVKVKEVLLTGATGFLGAHILAELLNTTDLKVLCLVRASSREEGQERLLHAFKRYKLVNVYGSVVMTALGDSKRVVAVVGDIVKPQLGVQMEEYRRLASKVDAVIHCAIKANVLEGYEDVGDEGSMRQQIVFGTMNILRFVVAAKPKHFCHASSLFAITTLTESGRPSEEFPTLENYTEIAKQGIKTKSNQVPNGYFISKFICEVVIGEAVRIGLKDVKMLRYPLIWGPAKTGFMPTDSAFNYAWTFTVLCMSARKFPRIGQPTWTTIMPADVAAALTLDLVMNGEAEHGVYNVTTETFFTHDSIKQALTELGVMVEFLSWSDWQNAVYGGKDEALPFGEDEQGNLTLFWAHPLFGISGRIVANEVSAKLARNAAVENVNGLKLVATQLLKKYLVHYLQTEKL